MDDEEDGRRGRQRDAAAAPSNGRVRMESDAVVAEGIRYTNPRVVEYIQSVEASGRARAIVHLTDLGITCLEHALSRQEPDNIERILKVAIHQAMRQVLAEVGNEWNGTAMDRFQSVVNESLRPLRDGLRTLIMEQAKESEARKWLQKTPRKGSAGEVDVFHLLKPLEIQKDARVLRVGTDGKPGDILLSLPSIGRLGHRDILVIEVKNGGRALGWGVLTKETHRAMEARGADACIWVNPEEQGFSTEVGPYGIGDNELGPWTATVVEHLSMAIQHTQVRLHIAYLQAVRPDVDVRLIEACLRRFEVAVSRIRTVKAQVGKIEANCGTIRAELRIIERDAEAALRDAMDALQEEGA